MRNINILLAIFLTLVSCTEILDETPNFDKDCIVLNVFNGPMSTKATNDGTEYERQINRLDCFFFEKDALDKCVYYKKIENASSVIGRQEVPIFVDEYVIKTIFPTLDECDVFVIANYPGSGDWTNTYKNTSVSSLQKIVLDLSEKGTDGTYVHDAADKPFVMSGFDIATKGDDKNASGTVSMVRAASKITITVKIPEWIEVEEVIGDASVGGTTTEVASVKYYPYLDLDTDGEVPLRTSFHHGVIKTYLDEDYKDKLVPEDYFSTDETTYKSAVFTDGVDENTPGYYTCEIDVPFYSYARAWSKGANDAPYLTLQMPWKKIVDGKDVIDTYYYQIMVNAGGLTLSPNTWYDLMVNVGVLGSLTESLPTEIKSDDVTYYVLDWTKEPSQSEGDRYEDVVIKEYAYLEVPETRIIINNSSVGYIPYDASHDISISMDGSSKTDEILKTTTTASSFYIDGRELKVQSLGVTDENFNTTEVPGQIKYDFEIPDYVYSPIYVYIKINMTVGDRTFTENVTIVQYPSMYIIPDWSTLKSVYVNGDRQPITSTSLKGPSIDGHPLGYSNGVQNYSGTNASTNNPMYVVNVTSFSKNNQFQAPYLDGDGYFIGVHEGSYSGGGHTASSQQPETKGYSYIIGDPRISTPDNNLGGNVENLWETGRALVKEDGSKVPVTESYSRKLKYYYPTQSSGESFRVVAPKFRIVSFNNASGKECTHLSAAMRCASVQEDGFPAGRWRLPTVAEIQYIIMLQEAKAIKDIFTSGSSFYATASFSDVGHNQRIAVAYNTTSKKLSWNTLDEHISVRCVYDEWYWGSGRDAIINTGSSQNTPGTNDVDKDSKYGDKYLFTWGDEPMR